MSQEAPQRWQDTLWSVLGAENLLTAGNGQWGNRETLHMLLREIKNRSQVPRYVPLHQTSL